MKNILRLMLVYLLVAHGVVLAASDVQLRFNWPDDFSRKVVRTWATKAEYYNNHNRTEVSYLGYWADYQLAIQRTEDRYVLTHDTPKIKKIIESKNYSFQDRLVHKLHFLFDSHDPNCVMTDSGAVDQISDMVRYARVLEEKIAGATRRNHSVATEVTSAMAQSYKNESFLLNKMKQKWDLIVGRWVGTSWRVGEVKVETYRRDIPHIDAKGVGFSRATELMAVEGPHHRKIVVFRIVEEPQTAHQLSYRSEKWIALVRDTMVPVDVKEITWLRFPDHYQKIEVVTMFRP